MSTENATMTAQIEALRDDNDRLRDALQAALEQTKRMIDRAAGAASEINSLRQALANIESSHARQISSLLVVVRERDRAQERARGLEGELRAAADSLGTLAVASSQNGFEDMTDVRGYAKSRWAVAYESLSEAKYRCSQCGCLPTRHVPDDEELRECLDCECTEYEI